MESRIGFNDKNSDEGDIEVVVEGNVRNIKRTIVISVWIIDRRAKLIII